MRSPRNVGLGAFGSQQLERDLPVELRIVGCEHEPRRAGPHAVQQVIPTDLVPRHGHAGRVGEARDLLADRCRVAGIGRRACGRSRGSVVGHGRGYGGIFDRGAVVSWAMSRPFRVLGLQQVAIGGASKDRLLALWVDLLGLEVSGSYKNENENVDEDILRLGDVELDLMQPLDPDARPRVHEPPLNHIGLWVDDLPAAKAWLEQRGVRFTPGGIRRGAAGHDVCFIHPKGSDAQPVGGEGVLIELVQAPPEMANA